MLSGALHPTEGQPVPRNVWAALLKLGRSHDVADVSQTTTQQDVHQRLHERERARLSLAAAASSIDALGIVLPVARNAGDSCATSELRRRN